MLDSVIEGDMIIAHHLHNDLGGVLRENVSVQIDDIQIERIIELFGFLFI